MYRAAKTLLIAGLLLAAAIGVLAVLSQVLDTITANCSLAVKDFVLTVMPAAEETLLSKPRPMWCVRYISCCLGKDYVECVRCLAQWLNYTELQHVCGCIVPVKEQLDQMVQPVVQQVTVLTALAIAVTLLSCAATIYLVVRAVYQTRTCS